MEEYKQYINDILTGKIKASKYIIAQCKRLEELKQRDDIYFDADAVQDCFDFIAQMRHKTGKYNKEPFILMPWQKWVVGSIVGIKYKANGLRVCRELFMMISRKNGKSSLIAALALYFLIADGEAAPSIGVSANSAKQARILFEMLKDYGYTLDATGKLLKQYRDSLKFNTNGGSVDVFASDASRMDGYNFSVAILDEIHSYKDNSLYNVCKSSMGFREQPLMIQITTAGFLVDGYPCFELCKVAKDVVMGVKQQDEFFPFLYILDDNDNFEDEQVWIKSNPSLDNTITREWLRSEVNSAKVDSAKLQNVKTKDFNIFCQSSQVWIERDIVAKCMQKLKIEDFNGCVGYCGLDLAAVSDLTALSVVVRKDNKNYLFNKCYIPRDTYNSSPNAELYKYFVQEGCLTVTNLPTTDYEAIAKDLVEISEHIQIDAIYYDKFNATMLVNELVSMGYNMVEFSQGLGSFNGPTKELEKQIRNNEIVIDKSTLYAWCIGNCELRVDHAGNVKPDKATNNNKIDPVIASIQAISGVIDSTGVNADFEVFYM